jgi:DNA-binding IclR family transcriptional regulator
LSSEEFFDTIKDGTWHRLSELADQLKVPVEKLIELSLSLNNHGIIQYQEETQRIKIKPEWTALFPDEKFQTSPN